MAETISQLLATHERALAELRARNVVRTNNGPWADYAELLVCRWSRGRIEEVSNKSFDVLSENGRRIQVKCRVLRTGSPGELELSTIRSFEFDELAIVLFRPGADHVIARAVTVPVAVVQAKAKPRRHVNGHALHATTALFGEAGVIDLTDALRSVARALDDRTASD